MKFKIDEHLPAEIAEHLRQAGHDAETVHGEDRRGEKDNVLLALAAEEGRV